MIGAVALVGRVILLGYERIAFKKASEEEDTLVSSFLLFGLAGVLLLPLLFFTKFIWITFLFAALSGLVYSFSFFLYVYSLSHYEASLVAPFYNFNSFFLLGLSVIILGDSFSLLKLLGIILLFYGSTFVDKQSTPLGSVKQVYGNRGIQIMIGSSFLIAVGRVIDATMIVRFDPSIYSIALYFSIAFYMFIAILFTGRMGSVLATFQKRRSQFVFGAAANAYSYVLLLVAFLELEVSVAEPLSMLSTLVTIVLSKFWFGERIHDRLVGATIMIVGSAALILSV